MTDGPAAPERSYRALLAVPWLGRILLATQLARIGQSMVAVAIVLFALIEYGSPFLAGVATLATILPGLLISPIAGALLDRHGRMRLILLDYLVAMAALATIAGLAVADLLPAPLLIAIAAVSSLTGIFSHTGLRSLFPMIVPRHLWERVNAFDSNGYVVATIVGPPVAATLVAVAGGPAALLGTGVAFGIAAVAMIGIPDPATETASTGRLLLDAWQGVVYTWRNRTLRGLGIAVSTHNLAGGMATIVVPLIVLRRLGYNEAVVGLIFALSGVAGILSATWFGRHDTRGREWRMLVIPMLLTAPGVALLLPAAIVDGLDPAIGLALLAGWAVTIGLVTGPLDIALFTVRQRRTDPAWTGRAFAVSMGFNFLGYPLGAALAGVLASASLATAIVPGIVACLVAALAAGLMIPRYDEDARTGDARAVLQGVRDEP